MKLSTSDRKWLRMMVQKNGKDDFTGKVCLEPFLYRAYDNAGRPWAASGYKTEEAARRYLRHHSDLIASTPTAGVHQKIYAQQPNGSFILIEHTVTKKESNAGTRSELTTGPTENISIAGQ